MRSAENVAARDVSADSIEGHPVPSKRLWLVPLAAAGVLEGGMALAHFGLQYEWSLLRDFGSLPAHLAWALFALNFSWSVLLLAVSALVLYAASLGPGAGAFVRRFVFLVGLFWLIHGVYVLAVPMPLPQRLQWIQLPMAAFPVTIIALHWVPLFVYRRSSRILSAPTLVPPLNRTETIPATGSPG